MSLAGIGTARRGNVWVWRCAPGQASATSRGFGFWGFYFTPPAGGA